jgi:dephospho-CoA kinase
LIVGITGTYCSGKDAAADYLISQDYQHISLSDLIREEATRQGLAHTRENLIALGNELRATYGSGVLAERALTRIAAETNVVITSIRNPGEVIALRKRPDFTLLALDAPLGLRWQRMQARKERPDNIQTLEEFKRFEAVEHSSDPAKPQLHKVHELADAVIHNTGTLEELHAHLDRAISEGK